MNFALSNICKSPKYKVISFDTETAGSEKGNSFHQQCLVEIAAHAVESGEGMQTLVNPGRKVVSLLIVSLSPT